MTTIPTREQTTTLAAATRSNTLTTAQREQVAVVLGMTGSAMRVAAQAVERHRGDPVAAAAVAGAWQPVEVEFARLVADTEG